MYRPLSHSLEGLDAEKKDVPSPRLLISLPRCVHRRQVRSHLVNLNGHIFFLLYLRRPPPLSAPLPQETSSPTSRFLYRRPNWWCTAAVPALKPARSCVPIMTRIPYATSTPDTSRYPYPPPPPAASADLRTLGAPSRYQPLESSDFLLWPSLAVGCTVNFSECFPPRSFVRAATPVTILEPRG